MNDVSLLRGFKDLLFDEARKFSHIIKISQKIAENNGFMPSYFPILEESKIYKKVLGEASDIVGKEMYNFIDKGENQITLRPEFTAGIVRSVITEGLYHKLPLKFFTYGPLFRYERPQKGRQRQFNQINFEYLGEGSFLAEAELIALINNLAKQLKINQKLNLEINSLGSKQVRENFKQELVKYLEKYQADLSRDSQKRLFSNPLRILDSKDKKDQEILLDAPDIEDFYQKTDKEFYNNLLNILEKTNIKYKKNSKLVRGLDYYNGIVFEWTTNLLGSQNAVFAGGRYDALIKKMGGKDTKAVGFAGGIERIMQLIENNKEHQIDVCVISVEQNNITYSFKILNFLRENNIKSEGIFNQQNITKKLKKANNLKAKFVIIIGDEEQKNGDLLFKDFVNGVEKKIKKDELLKVLG